MLQSFDQAYSVVLLGKRTYSIKVGFSSHWDTMLPLPLHPTLSPPPLAPLTEGVGCKGRGSTVERMHDHILIENA